MYLSRLILNPRSRHARRDISVPYEMHRTIMRAFPSTDQGGPGRVMFRLEPMRPDHPPVVIVQSQKEPDWSCLRAADYALGIDHKPLNIAASAGQHFRFRLRANPTVRRKNGDGPDARSSRHGLFREEDQLAWLKRKGQAAGFTPVSVRTRDAGKTITRRGPGPQHVHFAVTYEGILRVTDPAAFQQGIAAGIGPAKAFGFGLLSVAPA